METQKTHPIPQTLRNTYFRTAWFAIGLGVFIILAQFSILFLFHKTYPPLRILYIVLGALMIFIGALDYWIAKVVRIVTSPSGLWFNSPGVELYTDWANVKAIGSKGVFLRRQKFDTLVLLQPAEQKCTGLVRLLKRSVEKEIPLSMFGNWRESELGQEIKRYVPTAPL
jgi:hypothetical protein